MHMGRWGGCESDPLVYGPGGRGLSPAETPVLTRAKVGTESLHRASGDPTSIGRVLKPGEFNAAHFAEIEKTLLYVSEARKRAEKALKELSATVPSRTS